MTYDGVIALAHIAHFVHRDELSDLRAAGGLIRDLDERVAEGGVCEFPHALTQRDAVYPGAVDVSQVGLETPLERSTLGDIVRTRGSLHSVHVTYRRDKIRDLDRWQAERLFKSHWNGHGDGCFCHPASQGWGNKRVGYLLNNRESQNDVV